ncbi:MAG: hypothetical protein WCI41_00630 [bacterium]
MQTNKITIIGSGNIGLAIFHLLKQNKQNKNIEIYDRDPLKNASGKSLKECVTGADFIFLCIPSWVEEVVLLEVATCFKKGATLISLSKGITTTSRQSIDQLIENDVKGAKYALLSGPMFAVEIRENKMAYGVLATKEKNTYNKIIKLFTGSKLRLEYHRDVHSVAISAVLKNIYTIFFGMIDSHGEKNNTKGYLAMRSIEEMVAIMKILKLDERVLLGTAGVGDFIATSYCEHSQNRKLGKELFEKGKTTFMSEGFVSISSMFGMLGKKSQKLPIFSLLERVIVNKKNPKKEIEKFLKEI